MLEQSLSIDSIDGNRHRGFKTLILAALVSSFSVNVALSQDADLTAEGFRKLYDCSSYYFLTKRCYSSGSSEASRHLAVNSSNNQDKVIHKIFVSAKQAEILPETSSIGMKSSIDEMIKSTAGDCSRVLALQPTLGASCDKLIEDVPKQPYDTGKKSGSLKLFGPTTIA